MHSRQQILKFITALGEEDFALAIVDEFLQVQSYRLGIAIIVHRVRYVKTHLLAHTEVMLGSEFGVQDNRRVVHGVDMLLTKLTCFQSFDMNELIEIAFHTKLRLQTGIGVVLRRWTGLRKK